MFLRQGEYTPLEQVKQLPELITPQLLKYMPTAVQALHSLHAEALLAADAVVEYLPLSQVVQLLCPTAVL